MFSTQTKILILFLSDGNPLWKLVMTQPLSIGMLASYMGVSIGTIENWKSGKSVRDVRFEGAIEKILERIDNPPDNLTNTRIKQNGASVITRPLNEQEKAKAKELVERFKAAYIELNTSSSEVTGRPRVYTIATDVFGMNVEDGQLIIDQVIYERFSLLPNVCYKSRDDAKLVYQRFAGTYHLWVRREQRWLQAKLRVRYVVNIRSRAAVRCKMNAPVLQVEPYSIPHWEYDGFLTTCGNKVCWVFEQREMEGVDFFYIITCRGSVLGDKDDARFMLAGKYLTLGQDKARSIVTDDVLLQRIPAHHSADDAVSEMQTGIYAIDDAEEEKRISELFERFRAQA